jgi:restriction system protein
MARRQTSSVPEMLLEILEFVFQKIPAWTCIPIGGLGFVLFRWWWISKITNPALAQIGTYLGAFFAAICLGAGLKAWLARREREKFLKQEIDLNWVKNLSWIGFETQVAAVYQQKGYCVQHLGGGGADGGIDVKLVKDGKTTVVQCKHWQSWNVGVKPVRELFGVMTAEKADAAIFIASGNYTAEAQRFAEGKPIQLIGRDGFVELVRQFQRELQKESKSSVSHAELSGSLAPVSDTTPKCPRCGNGMILRTAKRGQNAGNRFWGCSTYPGCKGTLAC